MKTKVAALAATLWIGAMALPGFAPSAGAAPGIIAPVGVVFIGVVGEFFSPFGSTALNGDVTFISVSPASHRPAADNGCFITPVIRSGETETVNLAPCGPSGTFVSYHCQIHLFATATIRIA